MSKWSIDIENYCKSRGEQSSISCYMHRLSELHFKKKLNWLSIVLNVISFISATIVIFSQFFEDIVALDIANHVLSILVAALVKYYTSNKFEDLSMTHRKVSNEYFRIYDEINLVLSTTKNERPDPKSFMIDIRARYIETSENAPSIPKKVLIQFKEQFKNSMLSQPIAMGHIDPITISRDHNKKFHNKPPDLNTLHSSHSRSDRWKHVRDLPASDRQAFNQIRGIEMAPISNEESSAEESNFEKRLERANSDHSMSSSYEITPKTLDESPNNIPFIGMKSSPKFLNRRKNSDAESEDRIENVEEGIKIDVESEVQSHPSPPTSELSIGAQISRVLTAEPIELIERAEDILDAIEKIRNNI